MTRVTSNAAAFGVGVRQGLDLRRRVAGGDYSVAAEHMNAYFAGLRMGDRIRRRRIHDEPTTPTGRRPVPMD